VKVLITMALAACASTARDVAVSHASLSRTSVSAAEFGARGDDESPDQGAIQAALDACAAQGCAEVTIPNGRYVMASPWSSGWSIRIPPGIRLRGETRDGVTLVQAAGTAPSHRVIYASARSAIESLTIDGNRAAQYDQDEHRAGIFAQASPDLELRHVTVRAFTGDGIYIYTGSDGARIDDVLVSGNGRNGITFGGGTRDTSVTSSQFLGNGAQQLDSEPGAGLTVDGMTIDGCVFDGMGISNDAAVTVSGSTTTTSHDWHIRNNTINGAVFVVWASRVEIADNVGINHTTKPSVDIERSSSRITVARNSFAMDQTAVEGVAVVGIYGMGTDAAPARVRIAGNDLAISGRAKVFGVRVDGAISVAIEDNTITGPSLTAPNYSSGVYLRATNPDQDFESAIVRRNRISNFGWAGIAVWGRAGTAARLRSVVIEDNELDDDSMTTEIGIVTDDGTGAVVSLVMGGNVTLGDIRTAHHP